MFLKSKTTRSQIADLPEVDVELTDDELRSASGALRIVSGSLKVAGATCYSQFKVAGLNATNVITNGDWDTD